MNCTFAFCHIDLLFTLIFTSRLYIEGSCSIMLVNNFLKTLCQLIVVALTKTGEHRDADQVLPIRISENYYENFAKTWPA